MARQTDPNMLEQLLAQLTHAPDGLSVNQLAEQLSKPANARNIQRWLVQLVTSGKVAKTGGLRGRGVRYCIASTASGLETNGSENDGADKAVWPLSNEAQVVLLNISRPLFARTPVTYQREFLDSYQPNQTYYLSEAERTHLHQIGNLPTSNQPAGTYARHIMQRLLIDLAWNSSRLEGNTYSLLETEKLILHNEQSIGKNAMETQMILNHKDAIEFLVESAEDVGFNTYTIRNLHALLSNNLLGNPEACGRLREMPVHIGGSTYLPTAVPSLIQELFELLLAKANAIHDPFEQALFAMAHMSYLQAFDDVNKRVSRLSANIPLIRANLCPLSFVDMPQELYVKGLLGVYELNRIELLRDVFVQAYEYSVKKYAVVRESLGEPDPFRLQYRQDIMDLINEIIVNTLSRDAAITAIRHHAKNIPESDQLRFVEVVEVELMGLNEGNMARYRIRPSQFHAWCEQW